MEKQPWCLKGEEWRPVPDYESEYEVSNKGRVRFIGEEYVGGHNRKRRILGYMTRTGAKCGYRTVVLNGKYKIVRRLVASAFIPNPDNLPFVVNIDGNPHNDNVENLRWADAKYAQNRDLVKNAVSYALQRKYCTDSAFHEEIAELHRKSRKAVRCVETGVVYSCASEAAAATGVKPFAIYASIARNKHGPRFIMNAMNGNTCLHFMHADGPEPVLLMEHPLGKPVICLETYEVWPSGHAAAKGYGIAASDVYNSCIRFREKKQQRKPRCPHMPAFHFAFIDDIQKGGQQ